MLLFHISNQSLDLEPVVRGLAGQCDCEALHITNQGDLAKGVSTSSWMLITKNRAFLEEPAIREAAAPPPDALTPPLVWTDDFASLWQVLKF